MKMGILGAGRIAVTMAQTIAQMPDVTSWAVGARSLERAQKFAEEYGFEKAYGSYEELAADPELDLIYVATPHALHAEHIRLCLEHGKNVLAEKAFTLTADQAREVLALAEQKGLLLTEAIWTRYMPMRRKSPPLSGPICPITCCTKNGSWTVPWAAGLCWISACTV